MIRTTKQTLKFTNKGKTKELKQLLTEASLVAQQYLDYLWNNGWTWTTKDQDGNQVVHVMDIQNEHYDHPSMRSNVELESKIPNFHSPLYARMNKCILTQVLGMIGSAVEKQRRNQYILQKNKSTGKASLSLIKKMKNNKPVKPKMDKFFLELNSICADFQFSSNGEFDGFIQLKCIGENYGKLRLPVKFHRNNLKYKNATMMTSFLISKHNVYIRYEIEDPTIKTEGLIVGADQGLKDIVTLSNNTKTPNSDCYKHTLETITDKLARKKKGSKNFKQAQEHRKNFVNWSINQLDLTNIKQINLEKIVNINYGRHTSRRMKHWCNTLIRDKLIKVAQEQGVLVKEQSSTYRSQRCSECGMVRSSNRKGKLYTCPCGNAQDADLNASLNHAIELPDVPFGLRMLNLNKSGFFWKPDGFYDLTGKELTVPCPTEETNKII